MAEKNGSDKTLQPNPLIAQLIAQGAETAMTVHGFVGPATRDGFICLYPRLLNRSDSIEIALADILHSVEAPQSVLGAVILWVKKDARIHIRRVGVSEAANLSAENLARLRRGPAGTRRPDLVELRKGRLRMRLRPQQNVQSDYPILANGRGAGVKSHTKIAALAIVMIASSSVVEAQDGRPTTASPPGTTQGPWTSVKPGNSESRCSPGEYAVGIEVEVAPPGAKPCAGCVSRLRVICRRYGI